MLKRIAWKATILSLCQLDHILRVDVKLGAVAVKWLSCWLAEQEFRGSIPGLAATISEIGYLLLQVAIWLKYRWRDVNPQNNKPTIKLDFICMGLSLAERGAKYVKITKWKIHLHGGIWTHNLPVCITLPLRHRTSCWISCQRYFFFLPIYVQYVATRNKQPANIYLGQAIHMLCEC